MLKASVNRNDSPLIIVGLTEDNVLRLKNGSPILTSIADFGVNVSGSIAVIYAETAADLQSMLKREGLITPQTTVVNNPRVDEYESIRTKHEKILIATVGLPRSGKTTWAKSQAYPIVNPDSIRLAIHGQRYVDQAEQFVWATAKAMVRALFLAGHQFVILDATNNTRKRRDDWQLPNEWATYFKYFDTPWAVCLERAKEINDEKIIPIIERMSTQFEPLDGYELLWP
jgi:predicted kinase